MLLGSKCYLGNECVCFARAFSSPGQVAGSLGGHTLGFLVALALFTGTRRMHFQEKRVGFYDLIC